MDKTITTHNISWIESLKIQTDRTKRFKLSSSEKMTQHFHACKLSTQQEQLTKKHVLAARNEFHKTRNSTHWAWRITAHTLWQPWNLSSSITTIAQMLWNVTGQSVMMKNRPFHFLALLLKTRLRLRNTTMFRKKRRIEHQPYEWDARWRRLSRATVMKLHPSRSPSVSCEENIIRARKMK